MTSKAQRIAIAQACGRKTDRPATGWHDLGCPCQECYPLPDYLNDLNAMHEAEKILTFQQQCMYQVQLGRVVGLVLPALFRQLHATASQRAEAFLKTLNLWTE